MSTHPMISVIAEEMNRLGYGLHESHAQSIWLKVQAAQQHQGEPVMAQIRFRAVAKGLPEFGHGFGPWQEMSLSNFNPKRTAYLDNVGYEVETRALFAHADPGEVEQLRLERRKMDQALSACANERDALRSQLNALEELSRDDEIERLRERGNVNADRANKAVAEGNELRAKLAEAHALLRLIAEQPMLNGVHRARIKTLLSASAEPSAPVEIDERAEFEAWFTDHSKDWPFPSESIKCIARDNDWLVWQARAALARKP